VRATTASSRDPRSTRPPTAHKLLSCIERIRRANGHGVGITHVVDVLLGVENDKIWRWNHDRLTTYGSGATGRDPGWARARRRTRAARAHCGRCRAFQHRFAERRAGRGPHGAAASERARTSGRGSAGASGERVAVADGPYARRTLSRPARAAQVECRRTSGTSRPTSSSATAVLRARWARERPLTAGAAARDQRRRGKETRRLRVGVPGRNRALRIVSGPRI